VVADQAGRLYTDLHLEASAIAEYQAVNRLAGALRELRLPHAGTME
jgi:hypothetical protein